MESEICAKAAQCGWQIEFAEDGGRVAGVAAGEIVYIINNSIAVSSQRYQAVCNSSAEDKRSATRGKHADRGDDGAGSDDKPAAASRPDLHK